MKLTRKKILDRLFEGYLNNEEGDLFYSTSIKNFIIFNPTSYEGLKGYKKNSDKALMDAFYKDYVNDNLINLNAIRNKVFDALNKLKEEDPDLLDKLKAKGGFYKKLSKLFNDNLEEFFEVILDIADEEVNYPTLEDINELKRLTSKLFKTGIYKRIADSNLIKIYDYGVYKGAAVIMGNAGITKGIDIILDKQPEPFYGIESSEEEFSLEEKMLGRFYSTHLSIYLNELDEVEEILFYDKGSKTISNLRNRYLIKVFAILYNLIRLTKTKVYKNKELFEDNLIVIDDEGIHLDTYVNFNDFPILCVPGFFLDNKFKGILKKAHRVNKELVFGLTSFESLGYEDPEFDNRYHLPVIMFIYDQEEKEFRFLKIFGNLSAKQLVDQIKESIDEIILPSFITFYDNMSLAILSSLTGLDDSYGISSQEEKIDIRNKLEKIIKETQKEFLLERSA